MFYWVLILLICFCFYAVFQTVIKIIQQHQHLEDETLRKVVDTTIKYEDNYDAAIAHLGICDKCKERLDEISRE